MMLEFPVVAFSHLSCSCLDGVHCRRLSRHARLPWPTDSTGEKTCLWTCSAIGAGKFTALGVILDFRSFLSHSKLTLKERELSHRLVSWHDCAAHGYKYTMQGLRKNTMEVAVIFFGFTDQHCVCCVAFTCSIRYDDVGHVCVRAFIHTCWFAYTQGSQRDGRAHVHPAHHVRQHQSPHLSAWRLPGAYQGECCTLCICAVLNALSSRQQVCWHD